MAPKMTFALNMPEGLIIPAVGNVWEILERSMIIFGAEH